MAWSVGNIAASNNSKTSSTTLNISTGAIGEVGNLMAVFIASDNIGTTDGDLGDVISVTDSSSNTYTKALQFTNGQGAAAGGATCAIYYTVITTQISGTGTITITWASAITAKAAIAQEYIFGAGNTVSVGGSNSAASDGTTAPNISIAGMANIEHLILHAVAHEGPIADAPGTSTNYTLLTHDGSTGGSGVTNMSVAAEYRIVTSTSSGATDAGYTAADHATCLVALDEASGAKVLSRSVFAPLPFIPRGRNL